MARTIGTVQIDDMVNSFVSSMVVGYPRAVQLEQIHNRFGRATRVKEDANLLTIDVRGWWRDGGGKFWRDFEAALLSQSRVPFTLGDGTRFEYVDVVSLVPTKVASRNAFGATPDQAFAYVMMVASYEPVAREVAPSLQTLGSLLAPFAVSMSSNFETDTLGWTSGANTTISQAVPNLLDSFAAQGIDRWFNDTGTFAWTGGGGPGLTNGDGGKMTSLVNGDMDVNTTSPQSPGSIGWGVPVTGGSVYTGIVHFLAATTLRNCAVAFAWWDATGHLLYDVTRSAPIINSLTNWQRAVYTETAPAGAAYATLLAIVENSVVGEVHYIDGCGIFPGSAFAWTPPTAYTAANGVGSMALLANSPGTTSAHTTPTDTGALLVTPSTQYTAVASFAGSAPYASNRNCTVAITWLTSTGTVISTSTSANVLDLTDYTWRQAHVTATSPSNAAYAYLTVAVAGTQVTCETHYVDCVDLILGSSTVWVPPSSAFSTNITLNCAGTASSEPTWQFTLIVPQGVTVSRVMLQNITSGETCSVQVLLGAGVYYLLMDASGATVSNAGGLLSTPGNGQYPGLSSISVGWGCTLSQLGGAGYDVDFVGRPPTLVPSATPTIPPTPQPNSLVATINSSAPLTAANLSVIAPARYMR